MMLFAQLALFRFSRSSVPWFGKMLIAAAALAAARHRQPLARLGQIGQSLTGLFVDHHGPQRNRQHRIAARISRAIRAFAVPPALGAKFAVEPVAQQRIVVLVRFQNYASPRSSVAARRPASWHVFLAP